MKQSEIAAIQIAAIQIAAIHHELSLRRSAATEAIQDCRNLDRRNLFEISIKIRDIRVIRVQMAHSPFGIKLLPRPRYGNGKPVGVQVAARRV